MQVVKCQLILFFNHSSRKPWNFIKCRAENLTSTKQPLHKCLVIKRNGSRCNANNIDYQFDIEQLVVCVVWIYLSKCLVKYLFLVENWAEFFLFLFRGWYLRMSSKKEGQYPRWQKKRWLTELCFESCKTMPFHLWTIEYLQIALKFVEKKTIFFANDDIFLFRTNNKWEYSVKWLRQRNYITNYLNRVTFAVELMFLQLFFHFFLFISHSQEEICCLCIYAACAGLLFNISFAHRRISRISANKQSVTQFMWPYRPPPAETQSNFW